MQTSNIVERWEVEAFVSELHQGRREWSELSLPGADLGGLDLSGCDLRGACLRGARLDYAGLQGACLQEANLRSASFVGTSFVGADLRGANLRETDLRHADFTRAELAHAVLCGADARGAIMDLAAITLRCYSFKMVRIDGRPVRQLFELLAMARIENPRIAAIVTQALDQIHTEAKDEDV